MDGDRNGPVFDLVWRYVTGARTLAFWSYRLSDPCSLSRHIGRVLVSNVFLRVDFHFRMHWQPIDTMQYLLSNCSWHKVDVVTTIGADRLYSTSSYYYGAYFGALGDLMADLRGLPPTTVEFCRVGVSDSTS